MITCELYIKDNLYKLGFTGQENLLEDEVKKSLIQRYSTSLYNPKLLIVVKVSHPRQAEKELFTKLIQYKKQNEIFQANYENTILPILNEIKKKFSSDIPYQINYIILEKLLVSIQKKDKKIAKDLELQQSLFNWIINNKQILNYQNQQQLSFLLNNFINPISIGSNFIWYKQNINLPILNIRSQIFRQTFEINNWDRSDQNLYEILKRLKSII